MRTVSTLVNSDVHPVKKILVLQTAFIGDVILATALVRTLAEQLPSAEIQFMAIPVSQEIVENSPYLKKVWIYDKRGTQTGAVNVFKLARQLKDENFDAALVPHRSLRSALLVYLAGIPRRIGFDRSAGHFLWSHFPILRNGL